MLVPRHEGAIGLAVFAFVSRRCTSAVQGHWVIVLGEYYYVVRVQEGVSAGMSSKRMSRCNSAWCLMHLFRTSNVAKWGGG